MTKKKVTNKDVGVSRAPSAYALFCQMVASKGVSMPLAKRLKASKTCVRSRMAMVHRWAAGRP